MMQSTPTSRFCGNCGVQLFGPAFAAGQCLSCGYPITDTVSAAEAQSIAAQYQQGMPSWVSVPASEESASTDERLTQPTTYVGGPPKQPSKRRRGLWLLLPLFLILFALLFSVLHTTGSSMTTAHITPSVGDQTATATQKTPQPAAGGTVSPGTGGTPSATPAPGSTAPPGTTTPTPGGTPTPIGTTTVTATPAPGAPPSIAVSQTTFSQLVCVAATVTFTVTNSGGGVLNYQVSATSLLYQIQPKSGSLSAGQSDTVKVSFINLPGTITVSAPGATNTQSITIQCV